MSRLRNIPGAREAVNSSEYVVHNPQNHIGSWNKIFGNDNPIHIEVGMGKGRFIMDLASKNPNINYIGLERYDSVLLRALQKMQEREEVGEGLSNIRFLDEDAADLPNFFMFGEVEKIYLNFSDPWPKDRHARRRLTSKEFLERYDKFLSENGTIEFKTDNQSLFDFSVEEVNYSKFDIVSMTRDLHNDAEMNKGNIMTEYEEKFSSRGNPIYKYILRRSEK